MLKIVNPRAIFDRRGFRRRVNALADDDRSHQRPALLAIMKDALAVGREEIRRRFTAGASGAETVVAGALLLDQILRLLYEQAAANYGAANPTSGERLAVIAVGGYGRGELAPHSDVDLLFLCPYKPTPHIEHIVEQILYVLWDLGLKVGHSVRSIDDCLRLARADHVIQTSLLEARCIAGDRRLFNELRRRFTSEVVAGTEISFVEAKLAERDARHTRMGDSRYVLEPNIKDGKGGLRDLHTLLWIAKCLYRVKTIDDLVKPGVLTEKEARRFAKAQNFLWTLRCHLHYVTGRPGDMLTFDVQPTIGRLLGYTDHAGTRGVERFMKHYFLTAKTVGDLTRILCAAIEAEHKRKPFAAHAAEALVEGFAIEGDRLTLADDAVFERDPVALIRLFHVAHQHNLDIHPRALRLVTRNLRSIDGDLRANPEANRLFLDMLISPKGPESILRRLNEAGVFGRFIPDFGRVVAQMQHDMYHVYTVDEHTIRAIGILSRIERGLLVEDHPLASEIVHKVLSRRVLYLAVLLHDIAKGRGGNHSEIGAEIAERLCPRLGLSAEETENVAWLVRYHLVLSATAFKRDLSDPTAIADLVRTVQSPERLRLLLVLTVCDIRAVGPTVWNGWKAALLRDLYYRAEEVMSGGVGSTPAAARLATAREAMRRALPGWTDAEIETHLLRLPPSYPLSIDVDMLARHARLLRQADLTGDPFVINLRIDRARAVTEVSICTADRPGLFARLAGAFAAAGANIVDARIFTTADGLALDSFWIQDAEGPIAAIGAALADPSRLESLKSILERSLVGELDMAAVLARRRRRSDRTRVFEVPARVLIDDKASATHTVIEVNGRDRPGLLYEVTRALVDLKLQVSSAKISTFGERIVDVFYVKDSFGLKVSHPRLLSALRDTLIAILANPAVGAAEASTAAQ
jgi:[protein-PII] uridylyltransferase